MAKSVMSPFHTQAIEKIELIQKVGYPNKSTIRDIDPFMSELQNLSHKLTSNHPLSIKQISEIFLKIKVALEQEGMVPVRMYNDWNARLGILKSNLRGSS